jgi:pimeloyl-ACP methyl ester carboxylesterase
LLFLLWMSSIACASERNTDVIADAVYLKPQRLVEVERGRRLNVYCVGAGSPAVIFDSGLGDGMMVWALVQRQVAATALACAYDRAGLGFSDPSRRPGTSANLVDDLHRLLGAANIRPPYVLVGHSLGGMNIKLYAQTYVADVAGLVFVDPSHEDLARKSWELDAELERSDAAFMKFLQRCLDARPKEFVAGSQLRELCGTPPNRERFSEPINALQVERSTRPEYRRAWITELQNVWTTSAAQLRAARRDLGDIPLVVLTHEPLPRQAHETQEMRDAQNGIRTQLHAEIAALSSRGTVRTVHDSGHYFQLDQPQEVTAAVVEVVRAATNR